MRTNAQLEGSSASLVTTRDGSRFERTSLMRKLGAHNITHAVALAYQHGLLRIPAARSPEVVIDGVRYERSR
jgi:hypothetical protein